jgi:photosystem II stability/assembly factor-like uncharacterized protein
VRVTFYEKNLHNTDKKKADMKLFSSMLMVLVVFPMCLSAQWQRQYPLEKLEQVLDIAVHNDGYGFAVGNNDLILKLDPGTKTWDLLLAWTKKWKLEAVDYLPLTTGDFAAAGGQGLIITENGGVNWTEIAGAPAGIKAIKVFSPTDILVAAAVGVFHWKNKTWQNISPVTSGIKDAFILDDQHIWCFTTGANTKIYYTTDGGQNWNQNTDIASPDVVIFYNTLYGIAADGRMIYKTVDGGQHWTLRSNNAIANSSAGIAFGSSPNVLVAATLNNNPAISQDSGLTWTPKLTGLVNTRSFSIAATSDEDFWLGNDLSTIAHSTDGGDSWVESSGPTRSIIQDAHFLSRTVGFAVGNKGTILRTIDGGTNWQDLSKGDAKSYFAIHGLTANDLWMGTNQRVLHSTDMGENWTEKLLLQGGNISDVIAVSPTRVLACSTAGIIYRTTDSGTKWDTVYSITGPFRSIARIDDQRYMATGFNGVIVRSENQGDTWHAVTTPEAGDQFEQSYFLGNEGWLVTSSFKHTMWHTSNAGDSWDTITLPIDRFWDGVYFITPDTGIVVCHNTAEGRAYITFNGGVNWQAGYILPFPLSGVAGVPNPNGTAWIFGNGSDIEVLPYCSTLPVISEFAGDVFPCEKDTVTYTINSQDVENYYWSFPPGWKAIGSTNNDTVKVEVGKNFGNVSVYATNICGYSGQLTFPVSVSLLPTVEGLTGEFVFCPGQQIHFISGGTNVDSYHWLYPPSWSVVGDSTLNEIEFIASDQGGPVGVYGSNACGNSATLANVAMLYTFPEPVTFQTNGDTLSITAQGISHYQWFLNGAPIPGATTSTYIVTQSGEYKVQITTPEGCTAFSEVQAIIFSSTHDLVSKSNLKVYPSPARDIIYVTGADVGQSYTIMNSVGTLVAHGRIDGQSIQVSTFPNGIYIIMVSGKSGLDLSRFVISK